MVLSDIVNKGLSNGVLSKHLRFAWLVNRSVCVTRNGLSCQVTWQVMWPPHGHCHTATATRPPPHGHRHTATATRPPPHGHRHTVTATRSPPHDHRHTATATRPSHPWPGHVPGHVPSHVPGYVPGHVMSYVPGCDGTFDHGNLPRPLALRHSRRPLALWHPRPLLPFGPWPLFPRG